jgi:hypothetical protein
MSRNMAAKRAAKAIRRKAVVAEKRRAEALAASLPGRAERAAALPIQHCLLQEGLFEFGLGTVILARGLTPDRLVVAVFLVDVFGLGVKDAMIKMLGAKEFALLVEKMGGAAPLVPVEPAYARKLLYDVVEWAGTHDIEPHPDYWPADQLFGDVDADACDATFQFGFAGRPHHVEEPLETSYPRLAASDADAESDQGGAATD